MIGNQLSRGSQCESHLSVRIQSGEHPELTFSVNSDASFMAKFRSVASPETQKTTIFAWKKIKAARAIAGPKGMALFSVINGFSETRSIAE